MRHFYIQGLVGPRAFTSFLLPIWDSYVSSAARRQETLTSFNAHILELFFESILSCVLSVHANFCKYFTFVRLFPKDFSQRVII